MRRLTISIVLLLVFICSNAQESMIAKVKTEKSTGFFNPSDIKTVNNTKKYVFKVYGVISIPKGDVESHFLGNEIAVKWALVNELYLRKSDVSIGFGSSYSETLKPSILNAVYRMNSYYKKGLNKKTIKETEAIKQFSWILDCSISICHCPDTKDFENALAKIKDPDQIINLFGDVELDKN